MVGNRYMTAAMSAYYTVI